MRDALEVSEKCQISVGEVSCSATRRYLSVTQVAAALGYSRDRFYQLRRQGVFPMPRHQVGKRGVYDPHQLEACRHVVRTGIGVNGEPVMLRKTRCPAGPQHRHLHGQLKGLGLPCSLAWLTEFLDSLPYLVRDGPQDQLLRHALKALTSHLVLQPPV